MSRLVLAYARRHHVGLLALFVALGGTSYAASRISGASLKDRSVAGGKLKKGAVTRKELSLRKLGRLPSAERAHRATLATSATRAGSAARATRAITATFASGAENSNRLQGFGPSAFLPATRVRSTSMFYTNNGQTLNVFSAPPFTVSVSCVNTSPDDSAAWRISSSQPHMAFYGDQGQSFDVGVANYVAEAIKVARAHGDSGQLTTLRDGVFVTPSGASLTLHAYAAVNLPGHAGQCAFSGYAVVP